MRNNFCIKWEFGRSSCVFLYIRVALNITILKVFEVVFFGESVGICFSFVG